MVHCYIACDVLSTWNHDVSVGMGRQSCVKQAANQTASLHSHSPGHVHCPNRQDMFGTHTWAAAKHTARRQLTPGQSCRSYQVSL